MQTTNRGLPFKIWFGADTWQLYQDCYKTDTYFTAGLSYDPLKFDNHFEVGLYGDTAGWMNNHPSYQYFGAGLEARAYLFAMDRPTLLNPYIGAGYGVYYAQLLEKDYQSHFVLAPRFTAGLDISKRFFIEGNYTAFGNHFGRDMGRFGVDVGYRF